MKDYWRWDNRSSWLLRTGTPFWGRRPLRDLWWGLKDEFRKAFGPRPHWDPGWFISLETTPKQNSYCYCPTGSITDFRFRLMGFSLWLHRSRWVGPIPCTCEIGLHEYHVSRGEDCQCIVADMEES